MSLLRWIAAAVGGGAALLAYGAWTSDRTRAERRVLRLPTWPQALDGFRIGLLTDLHIRNDGESVRMSREACAWLASEKPDITVLGGDLVTMWRPGILESLGRALEPLAPLAGTVLAIPGNHEYDRGDPSLMQELLESRGIRLLRNQWVVEQGICFVGLDSALSGKAKPFETLESAPVERPTVVLWHEPDYVDTLPVGPDLALSGHTHGGQFCTPWGWPPMTCFAGSKYISGFFSQTPVPLYVSRGLGTTGPPSRWNCPPEVALLTLCPSKSSLASMDP